MKQLRTRARFFIILIHLIPVGDFSANQQYKITKQKSNKGSCLYGSFYYLQTFGYGKENEGIIGTQMKTQTFIKISKYVHLLEYESSIIVLFRIEIRSNRSIRNFQQTGVLLFRCVNSATPFPMVKYLFKVNKKELNKCSYKVLSCLFC